MFHLSYILMQVLICFTCLKIPYMALHVINFSFLCSSVSCARTETEQSPYMPHYLQVFRQDFMNLQLRNFRFTRKC